MNIFLLNKDPVIAAQQHCDKHVVKMVLETAQMLCTVHRILDVYVPDNFYRKTHENHPCTVWVRKTDSNYNWAYQLFIALCNEYTFRYDKVHLSDQKFREELQYPPENIVSGPLTPFPKAMKAYPDIAKIPDPVKAYQEFYIADKAHFAVWEKGRPAPAWWPN